MGSDGFGILTFRSMPRSGISTSGNFGSFGAAMLGSGSDTFGSFTLHTQVVPPTPLTAMSCAVA